MNMKLADPELLMWGRADVERKPFHMPSTALIPDSGPSGATCSHLTHPMSWRLIVFIWLFRSLVYSIEMQLCTEIKDSSISKSHQPGYAPGQFPTCSTDFSHWTRTFSYVLTISCLFNIGPESSSGSSCCVENPTDNLSSINLIMMGGTLSSVALIVMRNI